MSSTEEFTSSFRAESSVSEQKCCVVVGAQFSLSFVKRHFCVCVCVLKPRIHISVKKDIIKSLVQPLLSPERHRVSLPPAPLHAGI